MSSFSDNFRRDENNDTQYDDSAFYTFGGTILLVSILPLLYFIYKRIFFSKEYLDKDSKNCECKKCVERITRHYARIKKNNFNFTFYFMIFMVILLSYLFYLSYGQIVSNGNNFKRFDPFEILEIEPGVDLKAIKKAYRRLTLIWHPDKNPNNLQAKAKFIMIAKAYESLTDETAKKNFELYGNPDGPGSMRLAVGLPSFVLNKKNHMPILVIFLIFIVLVIPAFVWFWFSNSNKYDESGMIVEDQKVFFQFLNENILPRQMPFVLGAAFEFSNMKIRPEEAEELNKLWKFYKDQMPKHKEEVIPFSNRKAICIIYGYLNNHQFVNEGLKEDVKFILKTAPILLINMFQMASYFTNYKLIDRNFSKNFGYNCIKTIIEFSQNIHQKIPFGKEASPFLQIPHFTDIKYKNMKRPVAGQTLKLNSFKDFQEFTPEQRLVFLKTEFSPAEIVEIEKSLESIPQYDFKVETFVEGFDEILVEDLLTIKVTVTRKNLEENMELGVAHSNDFPEIFDENVVVFLKLGENRIVYEVILDIEKRVTTHEFKHMARECGIFKFEAELISLNYKGLDQTIPFDIEIKSSSEQRKEFIRNIEKREVKKLEPSLFQQMLQQVIPIQDDEEEEEEEETEGANQEKEDKEQEESEEKTEEVNNNSSGKENKLIDEPEDDATKRRKKKQN